MLLTGQVRGEKRRQEQIQVIAQKEKEGREMRRLSEEQKGKENFFFFFFFSWEKLQYICMSDGMIQQTETSSKGEGIESHRPGREGLR